MKEAAASADCTARVRSERLGQLEDDVAKLKAFIEVSRSVSNPPSTGDKVCRSERCLKVDSLILSVLEHLST